MNQILVTKKIYVTPELRRKKKYYKFAFIASILIIVILASIFFFKELEKSKNQELSQDILFGIFNQKIQNSTIEQEKIDNENVWKIIISTMEKEQKSIPELIEEEYKNSGIYVASNGQEYKTVGMIQIAKIEVSYPILSETTEELLKIAPCKFYGPDTNEIGNLCIAGHNWKNDQFFSKVPSLVTGDVIEITDLYGITKKYSVYDKYEVVPEDTKCTSQNTNGKRIITLITCTNDNKKRVIVHAKEII